MTKSRRKLENVNNLPRGFPLLLGRQTKRRGTTKSKIKRRQQNDNKMQKEAGSQMTLLYAASRGYDAQVKTSLPYASLPAAPPPTFIMK
jgi:hypothetical protein